MKVLVLFFIGFLSLSPSQAQIHFLGVHVVSPFDRSIYFNGNRIFVNLSTDQEGNLFIGRTANIYFDFDHNRYQYPVSPNPGPIFSQIFLGLLPIGTDTLAWANFFGGSRLDYLQSLSGTEDFGCVLSGIGEGEMEFPPLTLHSLGDTSGVDSYPDFFLVKINRLGQAEWGINSRNNSGAEEVSIDPNGNIFFVTDFRDTLNLDGINRISNDTIPRGPLFTPYGGDIFYAGLDKQGNFLFSNAYGGEGLEYPEHVRAVNDSTVFFVGRSAKKILIGQDSVFNGHLIETNYQNQLRKVIGGFAYDAFQSIQSDGSMLSTFQGNFIPSTFCNPAFPIVHPAVGLNSNDFRMYFVYRDSAKNCPDEIRQYYGLSTDPDPMFETISTWDNKDTYVFLRHNQGQDFSPTPVVEPFSIGKFNTNNMTFDWNYGTDFNASTVVAQNGYIYLSDTFSGTRLIEGISIATQDPNFSWRQDSYIVKYLDCSSFCKDLKIAVENDSLKAPYPSFSYTWFKDGIPFGTGQKVKSPGSGVVYFSVQDPDGFCTSFSDTLLISGIFSFEDEDLKIVISPNPTSSLFWMEITPGKNEEVKGVIEIYDLRGSEVQNQIVYSHKVPVDISTLSPGIYIAQIEVNGLVDRRKVVKK
jgi:Secretion system C-terminal sorting domain